MSVCWARNADTHWSATVLGDAELDVRCLLRSVAEAASAEADASSAVRLCPVRAGGAERWVVVAGPSASAGVNGVPLPAMGIRLLADRDEISCPGLGSVFFSTETLAAVVEFPGSDRPVSCGRCRQTIKPGSPAVKCPGCGIWYDQSQEFPCWCYRETPCAFCGQSTALDAGYNWIPEG
jgi:hypothetical protein